MSNLKIAERSVKTSLLLMFVSALFVFNACKENEILSPDEGFRPVMQGVTMENETYIKAQGNGKRVGDLTFAVDGDNVVITLKADKKINDAGIVWADGLAGFLATGVLSGGGNSTDFKDYNVASGQMKNQNSNYREEFEGGKKIVFTIPNDFQAEKEYYFIVYCDLGWGAGTPMGKGNNANNGSFITVIFNGGDIEIACSNCGNVDCSCIIFTPSNGSVLTEEDVDNILATAGLDRNSSFTAIVKDATSIWNWAFFDCINLQTIELPASLQSIGWGAFADCINLQTIELPASLQSIGVIAFSGCINLQTIELPAGLQGIGSSAFMGCINLQTIELPAGLQSIGDYTFYGCYNLQTIELPAGLQSIGGYAFMGCINLQTIELPASLQSIGWGAFSECLNLQTVTFLGDIGTNPPTIGNNVFRYVSSACMYYVPNNNYVAPLLNSHSGIEQWQIIIDTP